MPGPTPCVPCVPVLARSKRTEDDKYGPATRVHGKGPEHERETCWQLTLCTNTNTTGMHRLRAWFSKLRWHYNIDEGDDMHSASLLSLFARSASVSSAPKVACDASPFWPSCVHFGVAEAVLGHNPGHADLLNTSQTALLHSLNLPSCMVLVANPHHHKGPRKE